MPKIEIARELFFQNLGMVMEEEPLKQALQSAKAELDEFGSDTLKIELNDTNRPDLWSNSGLARQLNIYRNKTIPRYDFLDDLSEKKGKAQKGARTIIVDRALRDIRQCITGFEVSGPPLGDRRLKELIRFQEKLCDNYGRKRKTVAMGVYRATTIQWPVRYCAADPAATRFVPLGKDVPMSLNEILQEHPTGKEYGHILAPYDKFPYLVDNAGQTLSFPPIINSADIGASTADDDRLFIELTGTDIHTLFTACNIVACDFADMGYTIIPVTIEYEYDLFGMRTITTPCYFQSSMQFSLSHASRMLGKAISSAEAIDALHKMGVTAHHVEAATEKNNGTLGEMIATIPPYRNDVMHPVDIIEDIMMGIGVENFTPVTPSDYTIGRLSDQEHFARRVKTLLVGLGFQEMIYSYLGSYEKFVERMYETEQERNDALEKLVHIANPMSENYEYVRNSVIPNLLETEASSARAAYPHHIFEVGKIVRKSEDTNSGSVTINSLGLLSADKSGDFNLANSHVAALFYYLDIEYSLQASKNRWYIPGRAADIFLKEGRKNSMNVGMLGELHPAVLERWGIQMPIVVVEIDLDAIMKNRR